VNENRLTLKNEYHGIEGIFWEAVMEFTEDGLNLANSLKFAQSVHDYLSPWREQGLSDSRITKLLPEIPNLSLLEMPSLFIL
jgi:hypothetical protein